MDADGARSPSRFPPHVLREYALLADGERGAIIGPHGEIVWLCAPRWHSPAVFSALIGGPGLFAITPEARTWWERHDGPPNRSGIKRVRLPDNREVGLRQLVLEVADNPEIQVVTYFAGWDDSEDDADD